MHKISLFLFFAVMLITTENCSKSNQHNGTPTASPSQWNFNGNNYKGTATTYDDTSTALGVLTSSDNMGNRIIITFYSHPAAGGRFAVINGNMMFTNSNCEIQVGKATENYVSTGQAGDSLTLTITGGKLTASFTNVSVVYGATTASLAGTIVQQ
jgi:hypothetical protein